MSVKGDPKVPHATYKCELCDCYFNDDYAKKMHVKGRRHRLNYKKTYQPDLYVEPTKSQVGVAVCLRLFVGEKQVIELTLRDWDASKFGNGCE